MLDLKDYAVWFVTGSQHLYGPETLDQVAAETWILAGGAHHTGFSLALTAEQMIDWAEMAGVEYLLIDKNTTSLAFRNELRWSNAAWRR